jgi:hypothetical protein
MTRAAEDAALRCDAHSSKGVTPRLNDDVIAVTAVQASAASPTP